MHEHYYERGLPFGKLIKQSKIDGLWLVLTTTGQCSLFLSISFLCGWLSLLALPLERHLTTFNASFATKECLFQLLLECERLRKLMISSSHISPVDMVKPDHDPDDRVWDGKERLCRWNETTAEACLLSDSIVVPVYQNGKPTGRVEHLDYYEVARRRLDTLVKSSGILSS